MYVRRSFKSANPRNIYFWHSFVLALLMAIGWLLLGRSGLNLTVAFTLLYTVVQIHWHIEERSSLAWISLLLAMTFVSVGIMLNLNAYCEDGDFYRYHLLNFDSNRSLTIAHKLIVGEPLIFETEKINGYSVLISLLWRITGETLLVPILINYVFIQLTLILSAKTALILFGSERIAALTMLALAVCCYFLACAMVPYREPCIYFGSTACLYAIVYIYRRGLNRHILLVMLCASVWLTVNRAGGAIIMACAGLCFVRGKRLVQTLLPSVILAITCALYFYIDRATAFTSNLIVTNEGITNFYIFDIPSHEAYNSFLGNYFALPYWRRALMLPVTMSVQYIAPFIWTIGNSIKYGPSQIFAHNGITWYVVGCFGLWSVWLFIKQRRARIYARLFVALMMSYAIVAILFGGTCTRYTLVYTPWMAMLAAYVFDRLSRDSSLHKSFHIWVWIYSISIIVALCTAFVLSHR